jgi:uncharacterized protein with HEPN domain
MKQPDVNKYLADALESLRRAREFMGSQTAAEFIASLQTKLLIERTLEITGEALRRAAAADAAIESRITGLRKYVALRNVLAHGYEVVNYMLLWEIVRNDLPLLERELQSLIERAP